MDSQNDTQSVDVGGSSMPVGNASMTAVTAQRTQALNAGEPAWEEEAVAQPSRPSGPSPGRPS